MNESTRQGSVPTALPAGYTAAIPVSGTGPTSNVYLGSDWMAGTGTHLTGPYTVITAHYPSEFSLADTIRPAFFTPSFNSSPHTIVQNSVLDAHAQGSLFAKSIGGSDFPLTYTTSPQLTSLQNHEQKVDENTMLNNDASSEGLSARLMSKSPSNVVRTVPTPNPPSRDGTPANVGYRPWEQMGGGAENLHSQPSTPQSMHDMQNDLQRPPSAQSEKSINLKDSDNRRSYGKQDYLKQIPDPIQPPRSVETPGRPSSCISSAPSPTDLRDVHMVDEILDQECFPQLAHQAQTYVNTAPMSQRLNNINMQVQQSLRPYPNMFFPTNNAQMSAYVPGSQMMVSYPETKLIKIENDITELGKAENTFQVPSVSSTTPRQSVTGISHHQPQIEQWERQPTLPSIQAQDEKVTRKKKKTLWRMSWLPN